MNHFDVSSPHIQTDDHLQINSLKIETMSLEELDDAAQAVSILAIAIQQRRRQLIDAPDESTSDVAIENSSDELAHTNAYEPPVDKAKAELEQFYQSPRGKAIVRALSSAYQTPGTVHSITKPDVPLRKDALAYVIKDIVPHIPRTIVLDGQYEDIDEALRVPVKHMKGYGGMSSANAAAQRLLSGYHGTVKHLTVSMHEPADRPDSEPNERHLFDLTITKQPTGKPAFTESITLEFTMNEANSLNPGISYRLLPFDKSATQEAYEDDARRIGRTLISQNLASPLSGGLVSPR